MKTAVIFYSYEGNSVLIAEIIRTAIKADVFEIKTVDNKKRTGFAKFLWGGSQVILKKEPALVPLSVDINAYDQIILGTPVWAGSPAPALRSFLNKTKISGKRIALFCCHGGGKGKVFDKLKALIPGNTIAGEIDFVYPAKEHAKDPDDTALKQKIDEWVKTLV
jgi:flavodoxin